MVRTTTSLTARQTTPIISGANKLPARFAAEGYSERLKNAIESAKPGDTLTFRIDRRDFIDKLTEILEYVIDFSDEVTGGNFDEIVQEYRGDLFDSDLQEIIDNVTNSMRNNEKK